MSTNRLISEMLNIGLNVVKYYSYFIILFEFKKKVLSINEYPTLTFMSSSNYEGRFTRGVAVRVYQEIRRYSACVSGHPKVQCACVGTPEGAVRVCQDTRRCCACVSGHPKVQCVCVRTPEGVVRVCQDTRRFSACVRGHPKVQCVCARTPEGAVRVCHDTRTCSARVSGHPKVLCVCARIPLVEAPIVLCIYNTIHLLS